MPNTPRLSLAEWSPAQASPWVPHNIAFRLLEQGAAWFPFIDFANDPPGSPSDGDCYLIDTGTGAWAGHDGEIAIYLATDWAFIAPNEGMGGYFADIDAAVAFDGSAWNAIGDGGLPGASASDVQAGSSSLVAATPAALATAAAPQVLADGVTVNWDMATGFNAKVTLGGNRTLAVSNPKEGWSYTLSVGQDATGTRTLTWPASFDWGAAGAPVLSTAANKRDRITLYCTDAATPKFDAFLSGKGFS